MNENEEATARTRPRYQPIAPFYDTNAFDDHANSCIMGRNPHRKLGLSLFQLLQATS